MPCYFPLTGYRGSDVNPSGKRSLVFRKPGSFSGVPVTVPCGQCVGCRLQRARSWAVRCMHENRMHRHSCFVTLTYDDKHLPVGGTLVRRDLQLFLKRLRKRCGKFRFFGCGEYGGRTMRPHYHLLLFGIRFSDLRFYKMSGDNRMYVSNVLDDVWSNGLCVVGDVSFDSAMYCASYCVDMRTGEGSELYYQGRLRQFCCMSLKPGIGTSWFEKYGAESYAHDNIIVDGRETPLPRFYDKKFELVDPKRLAVLKRKRRREVDRAENTHARRRVREHVTELNLARTKKGAI